MSNAPRDSFLSFVKEQYGDDYRNIEALTFTGLADIHPTIREMTKLKSLKLTGGNIVEITNLETLSQLETLNLSDNGIEDLTPLRFNPRLTHLFLDFNNIAQLPPCFAYCLPNLQVLSLSQTLLTDPWQTIAILSQIRGLRHVGFAAASTESEGAFDGQTYEMPMCLYPFYAALFIRSLPQLESIDGFTITDTMRETTEILLNQFIAPLPTPPPSPRHSISQYMHRREIAQIHRTAHQRSLQALKFQAFRRPLTKDCLPPQLRLPRQFEYHPSRPDRAAVSLLNGAVVVANPHTQTLTGVWTPRHSMADDNQVLGLCWLRRHPDRFIGGSSNGTVRLFQIQAPDIQEVTVFPLTSPKLTSTYSNADDTMYATSGYNACVSIFDLETGKSIVNYPDSHKKHVNVVKFANGHPNLLATSSFDKSVKLFDVRVGGSREVFHFDTPTECVMVCWSPDDTRLLASATDNHITELDVGTGKETVSMNLIHLESDQNYTRAYYMNNGDYVVSGSCEMNVVYVSCAKTGKLLRGIDISHVFPGEDPDSIYCQSLRGDPHNDFHFTMLVAKCEDVDDRLIDDIRMITVNLLAHDESEFAIDSDAMSVD